MVHRALRIASAAAALLAGQVQGPIRFEDIASRAGVRFVAENSPTPNKNQPETMLAGVALFDYDGDGWLDLYFTNGAAIPSLEKEHPKYKNRLFRNNRDGTFSDVTERAGVAGKGYGMGVAAGDYDNDGRADLFVVNYCKWEVNKDPYCETPKRTRAYCDPRGYEPLPNSLFRNNGDGTFTDVSAEAGILQFAGKGMSVSFADIDDDGRLDAFVANDTMRNFLFRNADGKKFEEIGIRAGVSFGQNGVPLSGLGSDFRDINNDGQPDIWHTAVEMETFPLFLYRGRGMFSNATFTSGLGRHTAHMSGWSNGFADFDNDGWKDLFVARSNVLDNVADQHPERKCPEPNSVFRNLGNGRFEDASAGAGPDFQKEAPHRGLALGDIDNDGRIDAVVTALQAPAKVFRNITANGNHWMMLKLTAASNRMGLGARVKITTGNGETQWNMATTAVGYACSSDSRLHFGLGAAKTVREIEIRWPSGRRQVLADVPADRILEVTEPGPE